MNGYTDDSTRIQDEHDKPKEYMNFKKPAENQSLLRSVLIYAGSLAVMFALYSLIIRLITGGITLEDFTYAGLAAAFSAMGVKLYIETRLNTKGKVARCTEKVTASVCGFDTEYDKTTLYRRRFMFQYDGKTYVVRDITASSSKPEVGGEVALMVNPAFPSDCYSPQSSKKRIRFTYAAAAVFGMLPLVMIVIMYIESKAFA